MEPQTTLIHNTTQPYFPPHFTSPNPQHLPTLLPSPYFTTSISHLTSLSQPQNTTPNPLLPYPPLLCMTPTPDHHPKPTTPPYIPNSLHHPILLSHLTSLYQPQNTTCYLLTATPPFFPRLTSPSHHTFPPHFIIILTTEHPQRTLLPHLTSPISLHHPYRRSPRLTHFTPLPYSPTLLHCSNHSHSNATSRNLLHHPHLIPLPQPICW